MAKTLEGQFALSPPVGQEKEVWEKRKVMEEQGLTASSKGDEDKTARITDELESGIDGADIHNGKNENIWEIISSRYLKKLSEIGDF